MCVVSSLHLPLPLPLPFLLFILLVPWALQPFRRQTLRCILSDLGLVLVALSVTLLTLLAAVATGFFTRNVAKDNLLAHKTLTSSR